MEGIYKNEITKWDERKCFDSVLSFLRDVNPEHLDGLEEIVIIFGASRLNKQKIIKKNPYS